MLIRNVNLGRNGPDAPPTAHHKCEYGAVVRKRNPFSRSLWPPQGDFKVPPGRGEAKRGRFPARSIVVFQKVWIAHQLFEALSIPPLLDSHLIIGGSIMFLIFFVENLKRNSVFLLLFLFLVHLYPKLIKID